MIWAADAHRLQAAGGLQGNDIPPGQDHGQGPRPEPLRQPIGGGGHIPAVSLQPGGVGNVDDQRVILRSALGQENAAHSVLVQGVGSQTVYRFRGDAQKSPPAQDGGGVPDGVGCLLYTSHSNPVPVVLRIQEIA